MGPGAVAHLRNFAACAIAVTVLAIVNKGTMDLLLLIAVGWFAVSVIAVLRTRSAGSFVKWNGILLVVDALFDIAVMGTHLPAWLPPGALSQWNFDSGQGWILAYWIVLWGVALPNRTLAMADQAALSPSAAIALVIAVIGLHVTFVEDVIYFTILGYPPLVSVPPENYAYLPQLFGLGVWTAPKVWVVSTIGLLIFIVTSVVVVTSSKRTTVFGRRRTSVGLPPRAAEPASRERR